MRLNMTKITEIMNRMTIMAFLFLITIPGATAAEEESGSSLDEPLAAAVAILALIPLTTALIAYRRTDNKRLLILSVAFGIFFVKGIMLFLEHDLEPIGLDLEGVHLMSIFMDFLIIILISWTTFRK